MSSVVNLKTADNERNYIGEVLCRGKQKFVVLDILSDNEVLCQLIDSRELMRLEVLIDLPETLSQKALKNTLIEMIKDSSISLSKLSKSTYCLLK